MSRRSTAAPEALSADVTELFLALVGVIKRLRRRPLPASAELDAAMQGVTPAPRHIGALVLLGLGGPLSMSELADRLSVSLATTSQLVTELADWGLVERSTDAVDRRRTFVTIAPAHAATIQALLQSRLQPLQRAMRRLEPDEQQAFIRGLTVLAAELDETEPSDDLEENLR
ncbi:MAG: MarR family transcriptional regulator [Frankiales bacterium]|nr:MarR family transcriptional regulator [Frankiales bacterium]